MKVLVISHEYPPVGGGGGKVVQDLCEGLAAKGHQIRLLTAWYAGLPEQESLHNLTIQRLPSARTQSFRAGFKAMALFVWVAFWRGLRVIRQWQPDLIHAHFAVPAGAAAFALSLLTRTPYVITAHGGDVPGGAPEKTRGWFRFVLPFSKLIWKNAGAVAAVSSQTRQFALAHYAADIQVIPNGVNPAAYRPGDFSAKKVPVIIYIGRFSPEKNALAVPQILSGLSGLPWRCVMLGDGPQMDEIKSQIANLGLESRFSLPGWVDQQAVISWMAESDILLMPSLHEAMPMAGLQALAMGLAVIASEVGSLPDIVKNGENGFLAAVADIPAYTHALEKLLNDQPLLEKCRRNSRKMAARFDMQKILDAYQALYQKVLTGDSN